MGRGHRWADDDGARSSGTGAGLAHGQSAHRSVHVYVLQDQEVGELGNLPLSALYRLSLDVHARSI